jgi:hypothetical protein
MLHVSIVPLSAAVGIGMASTGTLHNFANHLHETAASAVIADHSNASIESSVIVVDIVIAVYLHR